MAVLICENQRDQREPFPADIADARRTKSWDDLLLYHFMKKLILVCVLLSVGFLATADTGASDGNWVESVSFSKVFIENKGQFILPDQASAGKILFQADFGPQMYFTPSGIIYCLSKSEKMNRKEKKGYEAEERKHERKQGEEHEPKILKDSYVEMEWLGANPDLKFVAEEKVQEYWNYLDPNDMHKSIDRASGYKKLICKNLYPNIDVEYVFHPKEGVKYNIILHPGADVARVKMKYTGADRVWQDDFGNISFSTDAGTVTDHAPETFYQEGGQKIPSRFILKDNVVSFDLGDYDRTKEVIIDPWVVSTFTPSLTVLEVSADAANNVYIYGITGFPPNNIALGHYIKKYNVAGVLQWTFNFTSATHKYIEYAGDLVVDPAGNVYVTNGFASTFPFLMDCYQSKLTTAGTLVWNLLSPNLYENWRNAFNCDYTQLIQVGCTGGCCNLGGGTIINTATGAESGMFAPPATGDVVSASYGKNGYVYMLSVKDDYVSNPPPNGPHLGCFNPATGFSTVFNLLYPNPNINFVDGLQQLPKYNSYGFNALAAGCDYLYVCLGATLEKRDLNNGSLLGSVTVPGGVAFFNSGTAVDKCGNVYVGSSLGVYVYDPGLNLIGTFPTSQPVYDIVIASGGIFYACGGNTTSTSNTGFVEQFSMTTICNPITVTTTPNSCGSGNIGTATATPLFCTGPYSYSWSTSPVQTTQTATGLAGGTYTVIVTGSGGCNEVDTAFATIPAGLLVVTVPPYVNVSCNGGGNGAASISASGGTAPFTYSWNPTSQTTSTATGLTAGVYSVTVTDAAGCSGTQTISITQPAPLTTTISSLPAACGGNNGSATVAVTGGSGIFTYLWNPSAAATATATGLPAGNYSVSVTDANGCTATNTVTVASSGSITATAGPSSTICSGQTVSLSASGGTTYSWSNGQTTAGITVTPGSTTSYSVVVSSGSCTDTAYASVTVIQTPTVSVSGTATICGGGSATLTASGGTNYLWSTGASTASITVSPTTNTTYSVMASNGTCSDTAAVTVFVTSSLVAGVNSVTICTGQTAVLTASGGGNYLWSTGSTANPISVSPASTSTYSVLVTIGTCSATATATVVVNPITLVSAWSTTTITAGSSTSLSATGGSTYVWSSGETTATISVSPLVTTTYCVTSADLCSDTSCVVVFVEQVDNCNYSDDQLFVPDAFSPNNDTKNDVLGIYYPDPSCVKELVFIIYDRWGEKVFEATDMAATWNGAFDGKPMNTAVFVYYMKVIFISGNEVIRKGNVSLVR